MEKVGRQLAMVSQRVDHHEKFTSFNNFQLLNLSPTITLEKCAKKERVFLLKVNYLV